MLWILFSQNGQTTKLISCFPSFWPVFIKYQSGTTKEIEMLIADKDCLPKQLRICTQNTYSWIFNKKWIKKNSRKIIQLKKNKPLKVCHQVYWFTFYHNIKGTKSVCMTPFTSETRGATGRFSRTADFQNLCCLRYWSSKISSKLQPQDAGLHVAFRGVRVQWERMGYH